MHWRIIVKLWGEMEVVGGKRSFKVEGDDRWKLVVV
jgi:hypothetical protein